MRNTLAWLTLLVAAWGPIGHAAVESPGDQNTAPAAAQADAPTFRAGVDLVTVDVTVLDRDGRPIQDLKPDDFTIKIDGTTRKVVAAELVKAGADANIKQGQPGSVTFDAGRTPVRNILIAIDQLNIPPGSLRPLLDATGRFIDALPPRDRVGLVTFPGTGPRTDFTTDRAVVKKALQGLIGMPSISTANQLNIGVGEARKVNDRDRHVIPNPPPDWAQLDRIQSPLMLDLINRNCERSLGLTECIQRIINESMNLTQRSRADAKISLGALESVIQSLASVDGAKNVVLISASLAIDESRDLDGIVRRAAESRTSFSVLIVDPFVDDSTVTGLVHDQAPTTNDDRRLRSEGLEELAADGRGSVYRIAGRSDGVFDRIALEMSASYVLGVESVAADARNSTRKLDVAVKRQGVRVQNRQAFLRTIAPKVAKSIEETLRLTLEAGSELSELPVRVATFAQWDAQSDKVRVSLAADLPQTSGTEIAIGYVVMDAQNSAVAQRAQKQTAVAGTARDVAPYGASLLLDPGTYSLRFSVVDASGKRASVVRPVTVSRTMGAQPATSDLIVGNVMSSAETPRPSAAPRITSGILGAYLELYSEKPEDLDWTFVHLDVARTAESAALATADADMADGARPSWRIVKGAVDVTSLPPGAYVARVRVVQDDKTVKILTQPVVIER